MDSISIQFKGGEGTEVNFEAINHPLVPGFFNYRLRAKRPIIPGEYFAFSITLKRGKLAFVYDVPFKGAYWISSWILMPRAAQKGFKNLKK